MEKLVQTEYYQSEACRTCKYSGRCADNPTNKGGESSPACEASGGQHFPKTPTIQIGQYIKALVDRPQGGQVKKGEFGKIISIRDGNGMADFPSQTGYNFDIKNDGYELMTKDFVPMSTVKFPFYVELTRLGGHNSCTKINGKFSISYKEVGQIFKVIEYQPDNIPNLEGTYITEEGTALYKNHCSISTKEKWEKYYKIDIPEQKEEYQIIITSENIDVINKFRKTLGSTTLGYREYEVLRINEFGCNSHGTGDSKKSGIKIISTEEFCEMFNLKSDIPNLPAEIEGVNVRVEHKYSSSDEGCLLNKDTECVPCSSPNKIFTSPGVYVEGGKWSGKDEKTIIVKTKYGKSGLIKHQKARILK